MSKLNRARLYIVLLLIAGIVLSFYVYLLWAGVILLGGWWGWAEWRYRHG